LSCQAVIFDLNSAQVWIRSNDATSMPSLGTWARMRATTGSHMRASSSTTANFFAAGTIDCSSRTESEKCSTSWTPVTFGAPAKP